PATGKNDDLFSQTLVLPTPSKLNPASKEKLIGGEAPKPFDGFGTDSSTGKEDSSVDFDLDVTEDMLHFDTEE
ncbi:MAG: hypothetical protein IJU50_06570, partial [Lachnospiraceae bacterium]|nr:hypothetical protein [Lachnospiraceae bacterium]